MTYTKLIEELKDFKNKSWDGMPEENIDAAIMIVDKMHRLHKIVSQLNLNTRLSKDLVHTKMLQIPLQELEDETWMLYSTIIDMQNIIMEEPNND